MFEMKAKEITQVPGEQRMRRFKSPVKSFCWLNRNKCWSIACLYCVPLTKKSTEICTIDSMAWTEVLEMFGWNSQALISLWLSCLLLSTIGLAVLYVTFQGPNRSGHFKPSPSLRPLTEQELAFLRKPKWSHFRDRLKKLSFKQISRKRIRSEKANG